VVFAETEQVRWAKRVPVVCRSLDSLVEDGTLPAEVGVLKVDTEGHDLEVVRGMGRLSAAVVMVEYWDTIPAIFGACPYTLEEMAQALAPRGYSNAVVVKRHDAFQVLQLGSLATRPGDWGNAIFVHDRVWPALAPLVYEVTSKLQTQLIDAAVEMRQRASHRRQVIAELKAQQQLPRGMARWLKPRLGHLRHHPPRPMEIPARYRAEPPVTDGPVMSIVTPTLNSERFVERTIQSVLDQGYAPLEYVVKDGGSSDATQAILERYRDRLGGVEVGEDSGQADGINRGFARTSGEIMAYLNSDDLLLPGTLAYVARFFVTHPKVDVVYGHRVLIDENDLEIGRWVLPRHESDILSWTDYVPQETLFWRRRIWERIGGMLDDTFAFAMDWDLLLRLRDAGARFVRLPRFLGAFRVHEGQKTSSQMRGVGAREIARLRLRVHGRPVSAAEVRRRTRGYLVRHIMYQKLYRLGLLHY
jgi:glycosyltransferase involved in cell wall biosynthesis